MSNQKSKIDDIRFQGYRVLSDLKLEKNMEKELSINSSYSVYVQVAEEGDAIYFSINKMFNGEPENIHRISSSLSVEDSHFVYDVSKSLFAFRGEGIDLELSELEIL